MAMEMTQDHQTLNTYYDGFGGGWRWGGGFGDATTTVDHYKVGTLVVDLFDAQTKQLVWRGSSRRYAVRQIRQEHQSSRQGSGQDVRAVSSGYVETLTHWYLEEVRRHLKP